MFEEKIYFLFADLSTTGLRGLPGRFAVTISLIQGLIPLGFTCASRRQSNVSKWLSDSKLLMKSLALQ
jgi:hypothetical protein